MNINTLDDLVNYHKARLIIKIICNLIKNQEPIILISRTTDFNEEVIKEIKTLINNSNNEDLDYITNKVLENRDLYDLYIKNKNWYLNNPIFENIEKYTENSITYSEPYYMNLLLNNCDNITIISQISGYSEESIIELKNYIANEKIHNMSCETDDDIYHSITRFIEAKPGKKNLLENICIILGPYSFYESEIITKLNEKYDNFQYINLKNKNVDEHSIFDYWRIIQNNESKTIFLDNFCYLEDYESRIDSLKSVYDHISWNEQDTTEGKIILVIPNKDFSNDLYNYRHCTLIDTNNYYKINPIQYGRAHIINMLTDYIIACNNTKKDTHALFKNKIQFYKYDYNYNHIIYTANILYMVLFSELLLKNHIELQDNLYSINIHEIKDAVSILSYFNLIKINKRTCHTNNKSMCPTKLFFHTNEIIPQCKYSYDVIDKELCTICTPIIDLRHLNWNISQKLPNIGGSYIKATEKKEDMLYYYKMSRYVPNHGIVGHESINEIICMNIAKSLGIECVEYELIDAYTTAQSKHSLIVRSKNFKPNNASKISLEDYYEICKLNNETPFEFMKRMSYQDFCYKLFIFDYLIFNRDRHGANIEFIYQNGKYRLAPLFDNGLSLMCSCTTPEEFKSFDKLKTGPVNNYIGSRDILENLKLVPRTYLNAIEKPDNLFVGLELYHHCMPQEFWDNIQEMFDRRWEYVKSI